LYDKVHPLSSAGKIPEIAKQESPVDVVDDVDVAVPESNRPPPATAVRATVENQAEPIVVSPL
jgi:hypothetical protein